MEGRNPHTSSMSIGKSISPVLVEIENALWQFEAEVATPPQFTDEGFRASLKVFMSALLDKMWALQRGENMPIEQRQQMAQRAGEEMHKLVKVFTDVDAHELYRVSGCSGGEAGPKDGPEGGTPNT